VSTPAVVIRLEIERRPVVYLDTVSDGEETRLTDWLDAHPEQQALVDRALELRAAA
jgi:hypothetical protein